MATDLSVERNLSGYINRTKQNMIKKLSAYSKHIRDTKGIKLVPGLE